MINYYCHYYSSSIDTPNLDPNPFDWSKDISEIKLQHQHTIPPVHQATLNVIGQWIESFQEDFRLIPQLQVSENV